MEKYNIILLAPLPPPAGGIGRWTERYLAIAEKHGIKASVVNEALLGKRKVFDKKRKINFFTELKRCSQIWRSLKKSVKKSDQNAIVHCCIPGSALSMLREIHSLRIVHRHKRKFIIHFRSTLTTSCASKFAKKLLKKIVKKSDGVFVLNEQSRQTVVDVSTKTPVFLIPNFILAEELESAERSVKEEIKTIVYVGGVIEEKGCDTIIQVAQSMPDISFRLVGQPSAGIKKLAEQSGCNNIQLTGEVSREQVRKELAKADVFLFLSRFDREGFSNAVLEAMSVGLPVIATDWAAAREQVGKYANQLVVPIKDAVACEKAIKAIVSKDTRQEVSKYNTLRVKEEYSESAIMQKYIKGYSFLLKGDKQ